jgi:hypothetical protein
LNIVLGSTNEQGRRRLWFQGQQHIEYNKENKYKQINLPDISALRRNHNGGNPGPRNVE